MPADADRGRWLVDGNNVMGSRPDGWWRDRSGAKARLVTELAAWAGATDRSVIVVFDGGSDAVVAEAADAGLTVRFAGGGRRDAADDEIVRLASAGDTVVTADRGLAARLPDGVGVLGPSRLLEQLGRSTTSIRHRPGD